MDVAFRAALAEVSAAAAAEGMRQGEFNVTATTDDSQFFGALFGNHDVRARRDAVVDGVATLEQLAAPRRFLQDACAPRQGECLSLTVDGTYEVEGCANSGDGRVCASLDVDQNGESALALDMSAEATS